MIKDAIAYIQEELIPFYSSQEINGFTSLILKSVCGINRHLISESKDKQISSNEQSRIESIVADLKRYRPIQYILGETEFFGLPFEVTESVLIPRPETEELVEWILDTVPRRDIYSLLDIGCGSGCISVTLAKFLPNSIVSAIDVSEDALKVAKRNALKNDVSLGFRQQDILQRDLTDKWDVIVSNPPYITPEEKETMDANVLEYEPGLALFVPQDDPLLFYRRIAEQSRTALNPGGMLFFEINARFGKQVVDLLNALDYSEVELRKDISGNDRMVRAIR